jgi:hypothetical protein
MDVDCAVVEGNANGVWTYQCACGNGFWCAANTAMPKFCPPGYFCETPAVIDRPYVGDVEITTGPFGSTLTVV